MTHAFRVGLAGLAVAVTLPLGLGGQVPPHDCKPWGNKTALGTMCTLAHDDTVKGRQFPAGTRLHYDSSGVLDFFWITKPAAFAGLTLNGTASGPHHALYRDGRPRVLWLEHTQDVQGVPCRPIRFWTEVVGRTSAVSFHPNGRLAACRLGRAATIQGRRFDKGARVLLDASGRLMTEAR